MYNKKQIEQLTELIKTTRTKLNKRDRKRVMTMITMDAHSRDTVQKLIREGVQSSKRLPVDVAAEADCRSGRK